ncbi:MAG: COG3014 family protein [Rhodopirellula sp. JB055]|uniref:COG3014 family protein n=1 Tax=Rhodopirellula sp. JB055 TaxID=3342846 RepID=UPI00370A7294
MILPNGFRVLLLVAALLPTTLAGCAAKLAQIDTARNAFAAGDPDTARKVLSKVAQGRGRFATPAKLDLAMVDLSVGNATSAEQTLRELRDEFDSSLKVAPLHEAASMVTDDTARKFRPAGYEQVMIRTMLAMCSLVRDGDDAESYINQAAMLQTKLQQEHDERRSSVFGEAIADTLTANPHQELALAPYLRGVLREENLHDLDDARRNYQLVSAIRPNFLPAADDLKRATEGMHSQPGHGALYVFALVGRGPVLEAVEAPTTTAAMTVANALMLNQQNKEDDVATLPKITSVKVPSVVIPPSDVAAVTVASYIPTGPDTLPLYELHGATQPLTDVAGMVKQQVDAEMPWTIARGIIRQGGKELAVASARKNLGLTGPAGTMFQFATSTAWTATETADTRCWGLLPREIQVLRAELPAGDHTVEFAPVRYDGQPIASPSQVPLRIHNAKNTYVLVVAPTQQIYVVTANP